MEKLCNMLKDVLKYRPNVDVAKLHKSGVVVSRKAKVCQKAKGYRIRAPLSALPIGAETAADPIILVPVNVNRDLLHLVLAISYAKEPDQIISSFKKKKTSNCAMDSSEFKSELNNLCTENDDPKMKRQVRCQHGVLLIMRISWSHNNPGRRFWSCPFYGVKKCKFFEWRDDPIDERSKFVIHKLIKKMEEQAVELKKKMVEEVGLTKEMEGGESSCIERDVGNENSEMAIGNENITTNEEMKVLKVEEEMKVSKLEKEMKMMKLEVEKKGRCFTIKKFFFLCIFFGVVIWFIGCS